MSRHNETTRLIWQTRQSTRKGYSLEEQLRIVTEGIQGEKAVSAICRREGIHSNVYCPDGTTLARRSAARSRVGLTRH